MNTRTLFVIITDILYSYVATVVAYLYCIGIGEDPSHSRIDSVQRYTWLQVQGSLFLLLGREIGKKKFFFRPALFQVLHFLLY